jgi:hypothetical protein
VKREVSLARALQAEADRLGIDPKRATRAELARIARALPRPLYDELLATARANGWERDEFLAVFVAPLLGREFDAS